MTIGKGEIVAIEVATGGSRSGGDFRGLPRVPWEASIMFIVEQRGRRCVVEGQIKHLRVGSDRAFYGFKAGAVTEQ